MKRTTFIGIMVLVIAVTIAFNVSLNTDEKLSDVSLANVEALAQSELSELGWTCFHLSSTDFLSPIFFSIINCNGCHYQSFVIHAEWGGHCSMLY